MSDSDDTRPGSTPKPDRPLAGRDTQPHARPPIPPAVTPSAATPPASYPPQPPPPPVIQVGGSVGGDVAAGDVNKTVTAGRDVVGRDVVTTTSTATTNVGFSAAAVQRLVVTVGLLVFVTAACFFSGGIALGAGTFAALNRSVNSNSLTAAQEFDNLLQGLRGLAPGQAVQFSFTEEQISSYFRLFVAPSMPMHVTDGKVRLLDSNELVVGGRAGDLGGLPFAATFAWQDVPGTPLRLTGAALRLLPGGNTPFGWVAVPVGLLKPVQDSLNGLFGGVQLTGVFSGGQGQPWMVSAVGRR